jgi:hypothetical protein
MAVRRGGVGRCRAIREFPFGAIFAEVGPLTVVGATFFGVLGLLPVDFALDAERTAGFARALVARVAEGAFRAGAEACRLAGVLLFLDAGRAVALPWERFLAAMPIRPGLEETRDYTYGARP